MYFLTIFASDAQRIIAPDASRMNFVVRLIMPWRLPAGPAFTRPEAVKLKRFFAADLVFILGISISMVSGAVLACHFRPAARGIRVSAIGGPRLLRKRKPPHRRLESDMLALQKAI